MFFRAVELTDASRFVWSLGCFGTVQGVISMCCVVRKKRLVETDCGNMAL